MSEETQDAYRAVIEKYDDEPFENAFSKQENYYRLALKVAMTVISKQAAYGDSFGKAGAVMKILYPDGIKPDQYDDALCVVRIIDKLFRVATDRDALGESPYLDICGYGLLGAAKNEPQTNSN